MDHQDRDEKPPPKTAGTAWGRALFTLAYPLRGLEAGLSSLNRKLSSLRGRGAVPNITEEELHQTLLEGEKSGIVESEERTMVEGIFYLGDRPVGAFMVHRSEIDWLDINTGPEEAGKIVEKSGNQRFFPVASGNMDQVSGMVSVEDVHKALLKGRWPGLRAVMRSPYFVPETMPAIKAFEAFKNADADCLFVTDEYGGFAGILTVRNLIEEIVGELSATTHEEDEIIKKEDGSWLADGSVNIDDAAKILNLEGTSGETTEYHTLAGFILHLAGEVPKRGAEFEYGNYRFKIIKMDGNRIDKIRIVKNK